MKNVFKVVFVIIGTIVGAGFASGKEIYSFFFIYGRAGIFGLILASLIIGIVIYKVFSICEKNCIKSYGEFCMKVENKLTRFSNRTGKSIYISRIFNCFINIFLLIMFYVMISGFSSFLYQEFNVNRIIGSLIIVLLCYITFVGNIDKLMKINNYLIPFLIIFIVFISCKCLINENNVKLCSFFYLRENVYLKGVIKAILYASYNCIILIPVLVQISNSMSIDRKRNICISFISSVVIGVLSIAVYNLLLHGNYEIFILEMPIIGIAKSMGEIYGLVYSTIIGIAIFTSAASSGVRFFE